MLNSTTLEVAIGMALVYLLLSLLCTAVNEGIAGILGSRAKNLEDGIKSLFTEAKLASGQDLAQAIYQHGLVQSLYRSGSGNADGMQAASLPSYIPSRTFSCALFDTLFPDQHTADPQPEAPAILPAGAPAGAAGQEGAATLAAAAAARLNAARLQSMLTSLSALAPGPGKEAIAALVKNGGGNIAKTRTIFESWYDDGMDRAAGWYKRKTQRSLFFLGLAIAIVLNVDSITVASTLWNSPGIRAYAVKSAELYAQSKDPNHPSPTISEGVASLNALSLPIGWKDKSYQWFAPPPSKLGLEKASTGPDSARQEAHPHATAGELFHRFDWMMLLVGIVGWLVTAIAMTLGAPFWFDTLNQFMVVRSTIKPREKSEVEASKDPEQK